MRYLARTLVLTVVVLMLFTGCALRPVFAAGTVNLDVKDANARDAIQMVFKAAGQGMVIDPDVQGTITMTLPEMPWEQALSYILDQVGAQFKKDGAGIYRISNKPAPVENPQQQFGPLGGLPPDVRMPIEQTLPTATKPKVSGTTEEEKIVDKIPMTYAYAGDIALLFGGTIIPLTAPGGGTGGYGGGGYGNNSGYSSGGGYGSGSSGFGSNRGNQNFGNSSGSGYGSRNNRR